LETVLPGSSVPGDGSSPSRPAYASALGRRFDALRKAERDVLDRRILARAPETLDEIGAAIGCTREYVRQIEARALDRLAGEPSTAGRPGSRTAAEPPGSVPLFEADENEAADTKAVMDAVRRLSELELPATSDGVTAAGFEPLDSKPTRLLLGVAKRHCAFGRDKPAVVMGLGRRWLAAGDRTPDQLIAALTAQVHCTGVVTDLVELWDGLEKGLRAHVGSDEEATGIAADVVDSLGLEQVSGQYAVLGGRLGVADCLARILLANGEQMSKAELLGFLPGRNERTVLNTLLEPPFVRVGRDGYALADWGAEPRRPLRDLLYEELDRHGQVAVTYLAALAERYGYSRSSITFYGSGLPDVIEEGGVLRRRRPGDPPAVVAPGLDGTCWRLVAGPQRGRWSCVLTVSHRRLYRGPQRLPAPIAQLTGLGPGSRGVALTVNSMPVHASWLAQDPYLFGGELRPVLDRLGFADGERIRLIVIGDHELLAERLPDIPGPDSPFLTLVNGAGLHDAAGQAVPDDEVSRSLAYAVGLEPDTPLPVVDRRLAARHNPALRQALGLIFPEIGTR
jgi:Sigma-70, region 4